MDKKSITFLTSEIELDQTLELISVLMGISVVSKRLASKLSLLEQTTSEKEGVQTNGETAAVSANAT